ncbi:MAG: hypothetical protein V3V01_05540 [Acidimicrobiales bacterium]
MISEQAPELWIDFIDEAHLVPCDETLSFGRQGDIVLDESNVYLHRQAGDFVYFDHGWWLRNQSSQAEMLVRTADGRRTTVPPETSHQLSQSQGVVQFQFGVSNYELEWRLEGGPSAPEMPAPQPLSGAETHTFGVVRINDEQRVMLVALSEPRLRNPDQRSPSLPANAEVAHRLGWTLRKFDRKLDYVCRRLSEAGVPGLRGERGHEAADRRVNLVEHMIRIGAIGPDDLALLEALGT